MAFKAPIFTKIEIT